LAHRFLRYTRLLTALVLALGLFGCGSSEPALPTVTPGTVRIVSSFPQKGYTGEQSRQMEQAIRLAIDEHNRTNDLKVEYIALDDSDAETGEWRPEKELANAQQAANDPSVLAYIGPYTSGAAAIALPVTNRAGLLLASPGATWPGLTTSGYNPGEPSIYYPTGERNFVGMMPDDSLQGRVAANWAQKLGIKDVAVLNDGSSYSLGLAKTFVQNVNTMSYVSATIVPTDLSERPVQLGNAQAAFYAPSSVQNAVNVAHALSGLDIVVFSTDVALDPQFLDGAGPDAARWHIISNSVPDAQWSDPDSEVATRFQAEFEKSFGSAPEQFAANAYDITLTILSAIDEAQLADPDSPLDRGDILERVRKAEFEGITGKIKFTPDGRPVFSRMSGYEWKDGRFQLADVFSSTP
jgi:branched-chain amino acid transport system substrate-binding protein